MPKEKNPLDEFDADNIKTPEVKPASEVSWGVNATADIAYTKECIVCDKEFASAKNEAGLCGVCKQEIKLIIKNR